MPNFYTFLFSSLLQHIEVGGVNLHLRPLQVTTTTNIRFRHLPQRLHRRPRR